MRRLATLLMVLGLALPAMAQDHSCTDSTGNLAWASGEGEEMRTCTVTLSGGVFDNVATGTTVEKSVGLSSVGKARLLNVELRSTNAASGTAQISIQTATGANNGKLVYNNTAIVAHTPETGGATYSSYLNASPNAEFVPISGTIYVRVYNGDVSSDDDFVVVLTFGS